MDFLIDYLCLDDTIITYKQETHVATDKRVDKTWSTRKLWLPIENQGQ